MKKVKVIVSVESFDEFEDMVNAFIVDKNILDIQYRHTDNAVSAMILYDEVPPLEKRIDTHLSLFDQIYGK